MSVNGLIMAAASLAMALAPAAGKAAEAPPARDYVEFVVKDIARTKAFYGPTFGWSFTDYGPGYASFSSETIDGGFTTDGEVRTGGPLMVFHRADLEDVLKRARASGGKIVREPFTFPGGRRFHVQDPDGYEIAVWSEK